MAHTCLPSNEKDKRLRSLTKSNQWLNYSQPNYALILKRKRHSVTYITGIYDYGHFDFWTCKPSETCHYDLDLDSSSADSQRSIDEQIQTLRFKYGNLSRDMGCMSKLGPSDFQLKHLFHKGNSKIQCADEIEQHMYVTTIPERCKMKITKYNIIKRQMNFPFADLFVQMERFHRLFTKDEQKIIAEQFEVLLSEKSKNRQIDRAFLEDMHKLATKKMVPETSRAHDTAAEMSVSPDENTVDPVIFHQGHTDCFYEEGQDFYYVISCTLDSRIEVRKLVKLKPDCSFKAVEPFETRDSIPQCKLKDANFQRLITKHWTDKTAEPSMHFYQVNDQQYYVVETTEDGMLAVTKMKCEKYLSRQQGRFVPDSSLVVNIHPHAERHAEQEQNELKTIIDKYEHKFIDSACYIDHVATWGEQGKLHINPVVSAVPPLKRHCRQNSTAGCGSRCVLNEEPCYGSESSAEHAACQRST